jgi:hypothetical protein
MNFKCLYCFYNKKRGPLSINVTNERFERFYFKIHYCRVFIRQMITKSLITRFAELGDYGISPSSKS